MTTPLPEAIKALSKAVEGTEIQVNFSEDLGTMIHWCGVIQLTCDNPVKAAEGIKLFKRLEALGAEDC